MSGTVEGRAGVVRWRRTDYGNTWHLPRVGGDTARCNRRYRLASPELSTAQASSQPMTFLCVNCQKKADR